jgi:hypothetical protein
MLFGKDSEIGRFLPAQGLPRTLPRGAPWKSFLNDCALQGTSHGTIEDADGPGSARSGQI